MVFLLSKRWEILYGTTKIQNKSRQALKISVKVRFFILKLRFFFSFIYSMLWLWQRFWVAVEIFFWIFEVPYKISHLFYNKSTIWLKIHPCFLSQISNNHLSTIFQFDTTHPVVSMHFGTYNPLSQKALCNLIKQKRHVTAAYECKFYSICMSQRTVKQPKNHLWFTLKCLINGHGHWIP